MKLDDFITIYRNLLMRSEIGTYDVWMIYITIYNDVLMFSSLMGKFINYINPNIQTLTFQGLMF
jgi:hypothetical protein